MTAAGRGVGLAGVAGRSGGSGGGRSCRSPVVRALVARRLRRAGSVRSPLVAAVGTVHFCAALPSAKNVRILGAPHVTSADPRRGERDGERRRRSRRAGRWRRSGRVGAATTRHDADAADHHGEQRA